MRDDETGRIDGTDAGERVRHSTGNRHRKMLRICFVQQWFNLSDPQAKDSLYDRESMRRFVRIELSEDVVPDETTILRFRHLLEKHGLIEQIFELVNELLTAKRLLLKSGTIVDATIIPAPSSTKNASKTRDPEMKQTRKRNQCASPTLACRSAGFSVNEIRSRMVPHGCSQAREWAASRGRSRLVDWY